MTTEELQEQGAIYFDKITDGFRDYKDVKLVMDEKRALAHFKNLKKEYGNNNAFADFYYYSSVDSVSNRAATAACACADSSTRDASKSSCLDSSRAA